MAVTLSSSTAEAYRLWLETDFAGETLQAGQKITVDIHIDTEGDQGLRYFSVSVVYPPDVLRYVEAESSYNEYYPLYALGAPKAPPTYFIRSGPTAPDHPPLWPHAADQINVDFFESSLSASGSTSTDEVMATLVFAPIGFGSGQIELTFGRDGNVFAVSIAPGIGGAADEKASTDTGAPIPVNATAVPLFAPIGLVLLVGAIGGLGRRSIVRRRVRVGAASTVLIAILAAWPVWAQDPPDADGDGVPDASDNCVDVANGAPLGVCAAQLDTDQDGYENVCDADFDNDGVVSLADLHLILQHIGEQNALYDLNCDGAVGLDNITRTLDEAKAYVLPGPSGLACAGSIPCPVP